MQLLLEQGLQLLILHVQLAGMFDQRLSILQNLELLVHHLLRLLPDHLPIITNGYFIPVVVLETFAVQLDLAVLRVVVRILPAAVDFGFRGVPSSARPLAVVRPRIRPIITLVENPILGILPSLQQVNNVQLMVVKVNIEILQLLLPLVEEMQHQLLQSLVIIDLQGTQDATLPGDPVRIRFLLAVQQPLGLGLDFGHDAHDVVLLGGAITRHQAFQEGDVGVAGFYFLLDAFFGVLLGNVRKHDVFGCFPLETQLLFLNSFFGYENFVQGVLDFFFVHRPDFFESFLVDLAEMFELALECFVVPGLFVQVFSQFFVFVHLTFEVSVDLFLCHFDLTFQSP